jgi:hypothetical protein
MLFLNQDLKSTPAEPPFVINAPDPAGSYLKTWKTAGRDCLNVTLRRNQPLDENGKVRAELRVHREGTPARLFQMDPMGSRRSSAIGLYVPEDWQRDGQKVILFQWHHYGEGVSGGNPPLAFFIWNDNLYCRLWHGDKSDAASFVDLYKAHCPKGQWLHFRVGIKWDAVNGEVEALLYGKPMFPKYSGPIGYKDSPFIYSSIGMYWPGAKSSSVQSHQASYGWWKIGETLADLEP